jgi:hypothetical protein
MISESGITDGDPLYLRDNAFNGKAMHPYSISKDETLE